MAWFSKVTALCTVVMFSFTIQSCNVRKQSGDTNRTTGEDKHSITVQLNWLHDPTFVAQYQMLESDSLDVNLREGGPNISPLGEVLNKRADFAIVGADIFLKYLDENLDDQAGSDIICIFIDFQRNPVGWVLHPDIAEEFDLPDAIQPGTKEFNSWVASQINSGRLQVGDKRGTETTSVWMQWRAKQSLSSNIPLVPVGFDPTVVLSAPNILYPVYLNEQPFKLSDKTKEQGKGEVLVVDPVLDDVSLYGNVIVTRRDLITDRAGLVETFQEEVRQAWREVQANPKQGAIYVRERYTGVSLETVKKQVERTLDFVFADNSQPGQMDVTSNGRWTITLQALQEAGTLSENLASEDVLEALLPPK